MHRSPFLGHCGAAWRLRRGRCLISASNLPLISCDLQRDYFYAEGISAAALYGARAATSEAAVEMRLKVHAELRSRKVNSLYDGSCAHCMNQPWLTTIDCPVNAFDPKEARNKAACARNPDR